MALLMNVTLIDLLALEMEYVFLIDIQKFMVLLEVTIIIIGLVEIKVFQMKLELLYRKI